MDISPQHTSPGDQPVTYIIHRRVKTERQDEFERWLANINEIAINFDGHLGANIIRPTDAATGDYVIIWRFDSYANLRKWEESQVRRDWVNKSRPFTMGDPQIQKLTGLEFWFTPPRDGEQHARPPELKMAFMVMLALYPLVLALHVLFYPLFAILPLPYPLQTLITVVIAVLIMTFFLMPLMTRLFSRWLYR